MWPLPASEAAPDLGADLALMVEAARAAGEILRAGFGRPVKTWSKGALGPVSEIDLAADAALAAALRSARPDYGWLSEETADTPERLPKDRVFIVDPLDGTVAFLKGKPEFCVSLGLSIHGDALAGVIYNPITEELFAAAAETGAWRNGARMQASGRETLEGARMLGAAGFYADPRWAKPWPAMETTQRAAIAYRLALVAAGAFDGVISLGFKHEWDICAGAAILAEAGAHGTDPWGAPWRFNRPDPRLPGAVAAGPALHALLIERVAATPHPSAFTPEGKAANHGTARMTTAEKPEAQLLHLVIGGELKALDRVEFENLGKIDFVGAYPNYKAAYDAWKGAAQRTVDNARMRYFILHAHRLLDPATGETHDH